MKKFSDLWVCVWLSEGETHPLESSTSKRVVWAAQRKWRERFPDDVFRTVKYVPEEQG